MDDYAAEPDLAAAVERYLERLSEASRHVPDALKEKHPNIDWRGVADLGNVLRHAYDAMCCATPTIRSWTVASGRS